MRCVLLVIAFLFSRGSELLFKCAKVVRFWNQDSPKPKWKIRLGAQPDYCA